MRNKLLFVVDLGLFKAFRILRDEHHPSPRLSLLDSFVVVDGHGRLSDKLTDEAGRWPGGSLSREIRAYGERHNIELELNRRIIQQLAAKIGEILGSEQDDATVYLAAPKAMNLKLIEALPPEIRDRIEKNLPEDLTKTHESKLMQHFEHAERLAPLLR